MGNNRSIQILRTGSEGLVESKQQELLEGQPLYNSQKNYLTIGKIGGGQVSDQPITVRKLEGWFDDNEKITSETTNKYGVYPDNNTLKIKNFIADIFIEGNTSIQIYPKSNLNLGKSTTENINTQANTKIYSIINDGTSTQAQFYLDNKGEGLISAPSKISIDTSDLDIGTTSRNTALGLTGTLNVTGATTLGPTLEATSTTQSEDILTVNGSARVKDALKCSKIEEVKEISVPSSETEDTLTINAKKITFSKDNTTQIEGNILTDSLTTNENYSPITVFYKDDNGVIYIG